MILGLVHEAVTAGASQAAACKVAGISTRSLQRWRKAGISDDKRTGPKTAPGNKLSAEERRELRSILTSPEFRDLSPWQIVARLADRGRYVASESTMYRVLREEKMQKHREISREPTRRSRPKELVATRPNQVWSWDITYLLSPVRGSFYYAYMVTDIFSRKVVAHTVTDRESGEIAARMLEEACKREGVRRDQLIIHSDNGAPMKSATLLATLFMLGVATSFSRPRVSNDNPYSEALFRTVKYRPEYPKGPFKSLEAAQGWFDRFIRWYNEEHLHSAIGFVTPGQRHRGEDVAILENRKRVYAAAKNRRPERWTGQTRNWSRVEEVRLNPDPQTATAATESAA